jgi:hypothetical protein
MQEVIGITKEGDSPLGEALTDFRKELRKEDKQLVLLFEDLAVFGMIDGWIYDLFREGPGTDLAPVRAVFAMTDLKYLERVPDGVKGVETFHFALDTFDLSAGSDDAMSFAARWLNVGRTGKEPLKEQMASATKARKKSNTWFKSYCVECEHKEECHEAFSSVNEMGLYPFNKTALESALKRTERLQIEKGEHLTPRSIMYMLREFLEESEGYLSDGSMPGEGFDAGRHLVEWELRFPESEIAPRPEGLAEEDWRRVLRTRVIWADQAKESEGIRRAFGLHDLEAPVVIPDVCIFCGHELSEVEGALVDESSETACAQNPHDHIHRITPVGPQPGLKHDESKVQHLIRWQSDSDRKLIDKVNNQLRTALYEAVKDRINFQWLLVAPTGDRLSNLLDEVLHKNSFNIENSTGAGHRGLNFELKKSEASVKLLISVLWLNDHKHWRTDQPALFSDDPEFVTWTFPYADVGECQVLYEDYVSAGARDVEEELKRRLARVLSEAVSPVDAAVVIATIARRCLGADVRPPDEDAEAWNRCVAFSAEGSLNGFSKNWQPIAEIARECLKDLVVRPNYATDLASAHQGTGSTALVLDVGTTRELAGKAWANPVSVLQDLNDSLGHFPDLEIIRRRIYGVLSEEATKNEVDQLLGHVEWILSYLGETEPSDAAVEDFDAAMFARDEGKFQPPARLREFLDAQGRIVDLENVYSLPALRELREQLVANGDSELTAFDLLGDSEKVVRFRRDWEVVRDCLGESISYVRLQIGGGGSDDRNRAQAMYEEVAAGLKDVVTILPEIFGGGG